MLEFSERMQRKARKQHYCDICGKSILPGCEYIQERMKANGEFLNLRRHIHCDAILDAFLCETSPDEYDSEMVALWAGRCCDDLNDEGKCSDDDFYERCDKENCFECDLVLERLLDRSVLEAARRSVRENSEDL